MRRWPLFATVVAIAAGTGLVSAVALRGTDLTLDVLRAAPLVARVACEGGGVRVDAPIVRAGTDGVRFVVNNPSSAQVLQVRRDDRDARAAEIVLANGGSSEGTLPIGPGPIHVACLRDRTSGPSPASELTVVDPDGLWISPDLACSTTETRRYQVPLAGDLEAAGHTARRTLSGLTRTDEIAKPGYPGTPWHGDLVVVIRDGATIGRVTRAHDQGMWFVVVAACAGSQLVAG